MTTQIVTAMGEWKAGLSFVEICADCVERTEKEKAKSR